MWRNEILLVMVILISFIGVYLLTPEMFSYIDDAGKKVWVDSREKIAQCPEGYSREIELSSFSVMMLRMKPMVEFSECKNIKANKGTTI